MSPRTKAAEIRYQEAKLNDETRPLRESEILQEWKHWVLIPNAFPYDMIYSTHHMLIPKRDVSHRKDLLLAELSELFEIINDFVEPRYDLYFDNMQKRRSVLSLYHVHLASYHNGREEIKL